MRIKFRDGLLFVSLAITYHGQTKVIDNIVIDTGATHSIVSPDVVNDLGLVFERGDTVVTSYGIGGKQYAFSKRVDRVVLGSFEVSECIIDFGLVDPDGKINGLLGLDLLMKAGAVIDLKNLLLYAGTF
ncbi:retropepsin-like aspartic protease [Desulfofundulus thermocisternus]|jgi:predicted aspartyl protease|uniref:retropepsin-like aspartic protease n=1 Tax=Desulfofundulus thermocisternus TaxID=42471 RepID=UPI00217EDCAF|nr:retropepsin-like aspartic protease [Desulfofundulus thermocisternus]MCS5696538.1 retropepsin-like domain-containing protein [Desulfofundulus thermocisternus]